MKFTISGKNIDVTEGLKAAVRDKLGKLERYFTPDTEVIVTMSVEKERQKIEVTIPVKGNIIRSEQVSNDMYVSIDLVEEIIERQLRRYKTKLIAQQQDYIAARSQNWLPSYSVITLTKDTFSVNAYQITDDGSVEPIDDTFTITKTK